MGERILLVEDEALVADMVRLNLEHAGFRVDAVVDGTVGLSRLRSGGYDLAVLDVMLPGLSGFDIVRRARAEGVATPVLLLTARGETQSKVTGFDAGADDYLTKPFVMPELVARVRALIRRHTAPRGVPSSRELKFGVYQVNFDTREAVTNEGRVTLTERECALLEYLAGHEGELLSRAELLENVWGMDRFPTARTVDNYVLRLRKLLEPDPEEPVYLQTVRGRGYRFTRGS
jgi:two-component system alkaline phosphatase synthesis response regulator PhoP